MSAGTHDLGNTLVKGISERNVVYHATLEVSPWANSLGPVDNLVRDDKIAGLDLFLQTANRRERNDAANADRAQSSNVCPGGHLVGSNLVVQAVTAQERHSDNLVVMLAFMVEDSDRRGGRAPGSRHRQQCHLGKSREFAKTSAADDSDWDRTCCAVQLLLKVG